MAVPLSVAEAIRARHTVRGFTGPLTQERQAIVELAIADAQRLPLPFNTSIEISDHPPGLGRMGLISSEAGCVLAKVPVDSGPNALVDVAYRLQHVVVRLSQYGIATFWATGSFQQSLAEQDNPGFKVPVAIAYGEDPKSGPRLLDRFTKWAVGSASRYPFEQLFFSSKRNKPITEDEAGKFLPILEAVRLGPSIRNNQPWRVVIVDEEAQPVVLNVFLAIEKERHLMDIGIALTEIAVTVAADGRTVQFSVPETAPTPSPLGGRFIISAIIA
jgi:nitroreductase